MMHQKPHWRVLLIGGGAREHAIGEALCRSGKAQILVVSHNHNPGLARLASAFFECQETDVSRITDWAKKQGVDFAMIGLEDPLEVGLTDALRETGIPTVGPTYEAAKLETSKVFLRDLMRRHGIPGQLNYHYFSDARSLGEFLNSSRKEFAIKPVGLTAGKGVKVMGVQLTSMQDAIRYGEKVIKERIGGVAGVVVEERAIGEEFSLQSFVDGRTVLPMPLVKDYKLAFEGDRGPNTGSMGSYSQANAQLPFVTEGEYAQAIEIEERVVDALRSEGIIYRGILYGQFIKTKNGIRLIEINARFGDPEAINVLPLLQTDLVDICVAILDSELQNLELRFTRKATVCKYITPPGYGENPRAGEVLKINSRRIESVGVKVYYAKLEEKKGDLLTTTSRSLALLGIGESVEDAEALVERALPYIQGAYHIRHDIGRLQDVYNIPTLLEQTVS